MSCFKAKCTKFEFRLGLHPRPRLGSSDRSPDPLTGYDGAILLLREGKGMRGKEREEEEKEKGGKEGKGKGEGRERKGRGKVAS